MTTMTAPRTVRPVRPVRSAVAQPAGRPRLTRRGRVAILLVLAALLFTAFSLGRAASQASSEPVPTAQLEQTTVQPGDTLWAVARRIAPQHDPREVIHHLRELNNLSSAQLQAGQQLLLPASR